MQLLQVLCYCQALWNKEQEKCQNREKDHCLLGRIGSGPAEEAKEVKARDQEALILLPVTKENRLIKLEGDRLTIMRRRKKNDS